MDRAASRLTVFFDGTFWVGVFERIENGELSAVKVTFKAEPRERDVYAFILKEYHRLQFSPTVAVEVRGGRCNPKRRQREVRKQMQDTGIGTRSQQALKMQLEQMKTKRKAKNREQREALKERKYEMKRQKRKEKHKGK